MPIKTRQAIATQTAKAIVAAQHAAATQTREAQASATAVIRQYNSYKTTAPSGTFGATGQRIILAFRLQYTSSIGTWRAGKNSKWIIVNIQVYNGGVESIGVNPLYLTLVSTDGLAKTMDSHTFELSHSLDAMELPSRSYAEGAVAFYTGSDFIPGKLVWQDFNEMVSASIVEKP